MNNPSSLLRFVLSIILAMCLRIAPWQEPLTAYNPDWILLTVIYWSLASPERRGIFTGLTVGILTDILTGRMLGLHALTYSLAAFFSLKLHKRLRQYPLPQQGLFIMLCLFCSQFLTFWLENLHAPLRFQASFWLPVITGTVCWPLVYSFLRVVRLHNRSR